MKNEVKKELNQKSPESLTALKGIAEILNKKGLLKQQEADALIVSFQNHEASYAEDFLIEEGIVEKEDLLIVLQEYYKVPAIDVLGAIFDHDLVRLFPKDVLLRNCCIPYQREDDTLFVITNDPSDDEKEAILREFVSYDVEFFVGLPSDIDMMIKDFYQDPLYEVNYEETIAQAQYEDEKERYDDEHVREMEEGLIDIRDLHHDEEEDNREEEEK
ncbi:MAG: Type IV-A pilus assembly ATPase PilB [candidate division TM6 bacterium GW2011_GWE2_42_60]|nr:MAG: Type IV-A pilus assembly ATPase PilB [candidate division TM6 bacterium GW2011_GWE2_42_60]HBY06083.1 hypothetical protein [Candidatus Dependentiae bacterium]